MPELAGRCDRTGVGTEASMHALREEFTGLSPQMAEVKTQVTRGDAGLPNRHRRRNTPPEIPSGDPRVLPCVEGSLREKTAMGQKDNAFHGNHLDGWVLRAERHFSIYGSRRGSI